MNKTYIKRLLLASIFFLLTTLLLTIVLIQPISKAHIEHDALKSYYVSSDIDFLIPEPGIEQINELKNNDNIGITEVTPYYSIGRLTVNGNEILNANGFVFRNETDLEKSPYYAKNITEGVKNASAGQAVIDNAFAEKHSCEIGDNVSFALNGKTFSFVVSSISKNNMSTQKGTVAFVLTQEMLTEFTVNNIGYSGAYIFADDYDACKSFLKEEYKPLGRLKDASEFETDELYNKYLESFNSTNWFLSSVDFHELYASESVKYSAIETRTIVIFIASGIALSIAISCVAIYPISGKNSKKMLSTLIRKHTTAKTMKLVMILYSLANLIVSQLIIIIFVSPKHVINTGLYSFCFVYGLPILSFVLLSFVVLKRISKISARSSDRNEL